MGSKADVVVQYNGQTSASFPLTVTASAPGIFTTQYGPGQAWAINNDSSFNSSSAPAARGTGWATGQGLVTPGQDGEIIATPKNLTLPWSVTIGGQTAPPIYALLIHTGEIQVVVSIPNGIPPGDAELILTVENASSRAGVTVAVK